MQVSCQPTPHRIVGDVGVAQQSQSDASGPVRLPVRLNLLKGFADNVRVYTFSAQFRFKTYATVPFTALPALDPGLGKGAVIDEASALQGGEDLLDAAALEAGTLQSSFHLATGSRRVLDIRMSNGQGFLIVAHSGVLLGLEFAERSAGSFSSAQAGACRVP
jgi:hypothetical protein